MTIADLPPSFDVLLTMISAPRLQKRSSQVAVSR
jgi:hypothetical protein